MKTEEQILKECKIRPNKYGFIKQPVNKDEIFQAMRLYSDQQNKELRERIEKMKLLAIIESTKNEVSKEESNDIIATMAKSRMDWRQTVRDKNAEIQRLTKEVETLNKSVDSWIEISTRDQNELTRLRELVRKCREYIDGDRISWQSFPPKNDAEKLLQEVNTELLTEIDNALNHKP